jgi:hypothetical protein
MDKKWFWGEQPLQYLDISNTFGSFISSCAQLGTKISCYVRSL